MSHDWATPREEQRTGTRPPENVDDGAAIGTGLDPYHDRFDGADEVAPVDRQADPAHWLPGRALFITAVVVGVALVATVVVCLIIWLTPPMHHLQLPSVPRG